VTAHKEQAHHHPHHMQPGKTNPYATTYPCALVYAPAYDPSFAFVLRPSSSPLPGKGTMRFFCTFSSARSFVSKIPLAQHLYAHHKKDNRRENENHFPLSSIRSSYLGKYEYVHVSAKCKINPKCTSALMRFVFGQGTSRNGY